MKENDERKEQVEIERAQFKQLLVSNLNYFGTFPQLDLAPVKPIKGNTRYEELHCLGYYPEMDLLEAIFDVKLPTGYKGSLCSDGSYEYIRFYVDWDGDGDYDRPDEDIGMVQINVHDIPDLADPCRKQSKPLSFAARINLNPKQYGCKKPNLVQVRAILSWDAAPTPGTPDYTPVWGNVLEKWIQIKPRRYILADFLKLKQIDLSKLQIDPELLDLDVPVTKSQPVSEEKLHEMYKKQDVPEHRFNLKKLAPLAMMIKQQPGLLLKYKLDASYAGLVAAITPILAGKPETKYEQLGCVGLMTQQEALAATLTVKLPYGYNGDLCTDGSTEHVAFWVRVLDQIEQQCVWRYLGTAHVEVHDIEEIPDEGLQYAVYLPYDFSAWRKSCGHPVVLQVRAVLSWQIPPSNRDPYEMPVWGNAVEALVQLAPDDPGIPGTQKPYIWSVGDMAVESISGNPYTTLGSVLGDGYANGASVGGGFEANESPFGGIAKISGTITNAPNNPAEADKLEYKVQYKKVGGGGDWKDIDNTFRIWLRIDGVPSGHLDQVAIGGYYKYQKDLTAPVLVEVQDDILAQWDTTKADGDGEYLLRLLLYSPGAPPVFGVPADHVASQIITVMLDNTAPVAQISLDAGPCTKFEVGDTFSGKYTATDEHIWHYTIWVDPITADMPVISPISSETYPALTPPGKVNAAYDVVTTASTTPCGYVIRIHVYDRAIVNNHFPGNRSGDSVGLCLLEEAAE